MAVDQITPAECELTITATAKVDPQLYATVDGAALVSAVAAAVGTVEGVTHLKVASSMSGGLIATQGVAAEGGEG